MALTGKAPPPLPSRPPPDPPPFAIPPMSFNSLGLTEPPEPPDPPDATFTLVLILFVDESHNPSPHLFSQVADLESPASTIAVGSMSDVARSVSTSSELSSTVRSSLPPCTDVPNFSLQSSGVEVLFFSTFGFVSLGLASCSDLKNLVSTMVIRAQELEYQQELYLSNSAIRALFNSLRDFCVDVSILVPSLLALLRVVLKPSSLQYAALRSLEDCTLDVDTLVVVGFVVTTLLNGYNSDAFHHLVSGYMVHLAQSLLSVSCYGVHLAQSHSPSQGKAEEANKVSPLHQARVRQAPRRHLDSCFISCLTDTASNKDKLIAGGNLASPVHGSRRKSFIGSPLIADAVAMQSAFCMASSLEFSLKVLSNNSTLIRAISGNIRSKEIIGIVSDIRSVSSGFATIAFSLFSRSENLIVNILVKQVLQALSSLY
ncbi:hypothetical protein HA466_0070480 [Hirschfeldia incana]|nr:hypothetical protein HA466_0070480 [Hirschfeldia incana]